LRNNYFTDAEVFAALLERYRDGAVQVACNLGLLEPATAHNITHPDPQNFVAGDVTVVRSRYKAAAGMTHTDPITGEIIPKLFDPDAGSHSVHDSDGNLIPRVRGTPWMLLHARLPHENERVLLDIRHVTSTTPETDTVVTAVTDLKRRAPGLVGLTYDMAMRGKQREQLYSEDLLLITRVPRSGRANTRAHLLAPMAANKD